MTLLAKALEEPEAFDGVLEDGPRAAAQWDPRGDYEEETDLGSIGEDARGVWVCRHPEAMLAEDPALWGVVERWRLGLQEITREDAETLSAWEMQALLTMATAKARQTKRLLERRGDGSAGSHGD